MSKPKHTPGPWMAHAKTKDLVISRNGPIAEMAGVRGGEEHDANASLIASAPELLACLEHMTQLMFEDNDPESQSNIVDAAKALIAKVKGDE
jgi:hypothetical protein